MAAGSCLAGAGKKLLTRIETAEAAVSRQKLAEPAESVRSASCYRLPANADALYGREHME
jgi:hypothetical protein